ncbi:MAG: hypothetical protein KF903_10110 [Dokdonella sp.]|uniref:DUF6587 family protein n=1 Tax=Dokdonella sp. TaxID=2291710 RepID=UPI0025BC7679|nr:DUF6587 family protein [Dokdonella sp.]MBX3701339.1 hypothetical protein [Dokdonella sp.]MCW5577220.1 hypothetical protein [Dokdonella sp.]
MNATIVQGVVVALIVGWATWSALRRLLPQTSRRCIARVLGWFDRPALPDAWRRRARAWQPRSSQGGSCGTGCASCGGCGGADLARADPGPRPLVFTPGSRRKDGGARDPQG